jgi:hypothetical protein
MKLIEAINGLNALAEREDVFDAMGINDGPEVDAVFEKREELLEVVRSSVVSDKRELSALASLVMCLAMFGDRVDAGIATVLAAGVISHG